MRAVTLLLAVGLALGACSGKSESNDSDDGDTGGSSSGSGNGGSGQGGSAARGGSSGTSSGTAGASSGGTSSGGANSGGASGDAGTGGTGAMRGYHPPDGHVQGCTRICEREAEAMCPNETTFEKCVSDCRIAILFEDCADLWDPVFECVDTTDTVVCNEEGEASVPDCVAPYVEVLSCIFTDGIGTELEPECNAHCEAAASAACPNGEAASVCSSDCQILAGAFPVCAGELETYLVCSAGAEQTCDDGGEPQAAACASPYLLFLNCIVTEYDVDL